MNSVQVWGLSVAVATITAIMWPAIDGDRRDSFPISTYPMFAAHRGKPLVHQLVGIRADGTRHPLPPEVTGSSEVLQAKVLIRKAAKRGKKARKKLCKRAARSVRSQNMPYDRIELVAARFDPIDYLTRKAEPISSRRLTRCRVDPK